MFCATVLRELLRSFDIYGFIYIYTLDSSRAVLVTMLRSALCAVGCELLRAAQARAVRNRWKKEEGKKACMSLATSTCELLALDATRDRHTGTQPIQRGRYSHQSPSHTFSYVCVQCNKGMTSIS
jgi:hypothetical protein